MRIENSFIPVRGVGEKTERKLWREGVTHWDEFDPSLVGTTQARRIESFIEDARPLLADGDARYFHDAFPSGERWRLYENFRDTACFFDIETTGLDERRDRVTTVSFHRGGETRTLVRGDDLTRENLQAQFDGADLLVTFNGKRFDVPFLETSYDLTIDDPHLDLMHTCRKLGLSGGLKAIEREVGLDRDGPDITGRDAVRLWREYEDANDDEALETLISYNRDDTVNLERLMETVTGRLHDQVFERTVTGAD